jgi:raffinose/stachyose/melibiose transport system substrate-binding protein
MNKLPRLLALTLAISMLLLSVGGMNTVRAADPVKIKMWHIATEADPMHPAMKAAIDRYNAAHTDIQIETTEIANDEFKTQLQVAVAGGQVPDVFQTWGGGLLQEYVNSGVVREVAGLTGDIEKKFAGGSLAPSTFGGKHYAVPTNLAGVFLWTNVDLFKENNLALPDTWTNFIAACKGLTAKGITPVQLGNKDKWPGAFWLIYLSTRIGGPDAFVNAFNRTNGGTFEDPAFVGAGKAIQEAVDAGCFETGYNGTGYDQTLIGSGQAAMQLQGDWNLGGMKNVDKELVEKSIQPLPFPMVEGGKGAATDMVGGTGQAFAISAKAPKETEAAIIEMLSSDEFAKDVAAAGFMPALVGFDTEIKDPIVQQMAKTLASATFMQLYYDQFLPPALAQVHLQTTQDLFGKATTPEAAAKAMEEAAKQIIDLKATAAK